MIPIIIGIITFIGFTGIIALLPKITLYPGTALYNSNPLDITFTLSNEGLLKIRNINYEIEILISFKTLGWTFKNRFRYLAEKNINNQWQWTPKASSEKY